MTAPNLPEPPTGGKEPTVAGGVVDDDGASPQVAGRTLDATASGSEQPTIQAS